MIMKSEPRGAPKPRTVANGFEKCDRTNNTLQIIDNRTGNEYTLSINRNSISAMHFKQIKAPQDADNPCDQTEYGIRVYDPGFGNTAVSESSITYKSVTWVFVCSIPDVHTATASKEYYVIVAMTLATWSPGKNLSIRNSCCFKVTYRPQRKDDNGSVISPVSLSLTKASLTSFALFRK